MCGIVAYSGVKPLDRDKINILFLYNETRGKDSSGYYVNDKTKEFGSERITKKLGAVSEKLLPTLSNYGEHTLFIGHVRKGSSGISQDENNAHPFATENYVGVHNGTFTSSLLPEIRTYYKFEYKDTSVDSLLFYSVLNKEKDFHKAFSRFQGGAALVFTSKEHQDCIFVYRNEDRELFRGTLKDSEGNKAIYISSMKEPLEVIGCTNVKIFKPNVLYTISEGEVKNTNLKKVVYEPVPKPVSVVTTSSNDIEAKFSNIEVLHEVKRVRKPVKIGDSPFAVYNNTYEFEDNSFGVFSSSDCVDNMLEYDYIYCKTRKAYYIRVYFGYQTMAGGYRSKFIEFPLDLNVLQNDILQTESTTNIPDVVHSDLEGVANLMFSIYGVLNSYKDKMVKVLNTGETSDLNMVQYYDVLRMIEEFMSIATD